MSDYQILKKGWQNSLKPPLLPVIGTFSTKRQFTLHDCIACSHV